MKILLLGSGGRESALAWKMAQSPSCEALFIAPGNAGTASFGKNLDIKTTDFEAIKSFCAAEKISLVVVGPEEPLCRGVVDFFEKDELLKDIKIVGPSAVGAQLEGSKSWAKSFMKRHGVPTAAYAEFTKKDLEAGLFYLEKQPLPIVLKADGLAAGKGVVICQTHEEAKNELREMLEGKFGAASERVVVEQFLDGIEFSVFALTDGKNYKILPEAKDYKRVGEGDTGPNTGGMGAVSPVPFATAALMDAVEKTIIRPTIAGLKKEKIGYRGFVFFGLIVCAGEPFVIEYNCRLGDPETEVVLPRLKNDLVELFSALFDGRLSKVKIKKERRAAAAVMLCSGGYPSDYKKGLAINGLEKTRGSLLFHAGTRAVGDEILTDGGRVLAVTSLAPTIEKAAARSVRNAKKVKFRGRFFRSDIGRDVLKMG